MCTNKLVRSAKPVPSRSAPLIRSAPTFPLRLVYPLRPAPLSNILSLLLGRHSYHLSKPLAHIWPFHNTPSFFSLTTLFCESVTMSQYGNYQPNYNPSAQNLQFYPSSYGNQPVSGHSTPFQAYSGSAQSGGFQGAGYGAGFSAPGGVSGRMGEQGGLKTGWLAAFGTEGYEGEPPLLEELGVNFGHIKTKVCGLDGIILRFLIALCWAFVNDSYSRHSRC